LLGWEAGSGEFIIYENTKRQWYYDNAEQVSLGKLGDINPVVVCYTTFYSETQLRGHCVVALPEGDIGSSNDLEKLHGAKMFEPQTGEYLGEVDKNFSLCSGEDCGKSTNDIIIVISTNDFYKMESGSWQSFGLALDKIQNFKEKF
jgi:hypothetical protein